MMMMPKILVTVVTVVKVCNTNMTVFLIDYFLLIFLTSLSFEHCLTSYQATHILEYKLKIDTNVLSKNRLPPPHRRIKKSRKKRKNCPDPLFKAQCLVYLAAECLILYFHIVQSNFHSMI